MKSRTFILANALLLVLFFSNFNLKACDRSNLMLNDIVDLGGNQYRIEMTFCTGGGFENGVYGGDQNTGNFAFMVHDASVQSFTASVTSPQTGAVYTGFFASGDSIVGYIGPSDWYAKITPGSGPLTDVCSDVYIITDGMPSNIEIWGLEGADNLLGGCSGLTTEVDPNCHPFSVITGAGHTVYSGYAPEECTDISATVSSGSGNYSYEWSTGSTASSVNVCPTTPTTYRVTVTDNVSGCMAISYAYVDVVDVTCGSQGNKVLVCDGSQTRCVPSHRVDDYLNGGAVLGPCGPKKNGQIIEEFDTQALSLTVFPNPVVESATLRFTLPASENAVLEVFDMQGMKVATLFQGLADGEFENEVKFAPNALPSGMYLAKLTTDSGLAMTEKIIVKK